MNVGNCHVNFLVKAAMSAHWSLRVWEDPQTTAVFIRCREGHSSCEKLFAVSHAMTTHVANTIFWKLTRRNGQLSYRENHPKFHVCLPCWLLRRKPNVMLAVSFIEICDNADGNCLESVKSYSLELLAGL